MRRLLSFLLKAGVSALLLYLALRRVDLSQVAARLGGMDLRWVAFVLAVLCLQLPVLALRWREVAGACGAVLPAGHAMRFTFIGQFFSQVLPSTVGGDAVRIWLFARDGAGWPAAIYSVLIDRVIGVTVLAALVVACLPWTLALVQDPIARLALAAIGAGALGGAVVFLALGSRPLRGLERWWVTRHLVTASRMTWQLCRSAAVWRVALLSLAIHLLTVAVAWGASRAAQAPVDFVLVLFLVLPVVLIATVPISIAGWGVRESAMILAFAYAGLPESDGLIVSIIFGTATMTVGIIGGIVWIASGYRWRTLKDIGSGPPPA